MEVPSRSRTHTSRAARPGQHERLARVMFPSNSFNSAWFSKPNTMSLQMYDPPNPDQPDLLEEEDEEAGLSFVLPHWTTKRHLTGGNPKSLSSSSSSPSLDWRLKSRLKTHAAALVICLNIATDPPDIVKTKPCAKLECWVDPSTMRPEKACSFLLPLFQPSPPFKES